MSPPARIDRGGDLRDHPVPHLLVESKKELHGWYRDERECTSERMLVNPYNGCTNGCVYCYAKSYAGYFKTYREKGVVTVFQEFDKVVAAQLDSLNVASCGYLSPVTDPFQKLEETYHLSFRIVREFVKRNIPIEFITKSVVPERVLDQMTEQVHSFGQVSITTNDEGKRRLLMDDGATTEELFRQVAAIRGRGLHAVVRIDPVIPFITDSRIELSDLISKASDFGACHIVASVMDVPIGMKSHIFERLKAFGTGKAFDLRRLYSENICGYLNASISYRKRIFDLLRGECDRRGLSFALCMEFELLDDMPNGLNREFMSAANCEGIDIPIYVREGDRFRPAADCNGNCLSCGDAKCGIEDLAMARSEDTRRTFKLADYRRWSRLLAQQTAPLTARSKGVTREEIV
ncbi:MAG: radical SAM protein [bacterium]